MTDLTTKQAAERCNCAASHLENLRLKHPASSPPFYRLGKLVRYPAPQLDAWIASRLEGGAAA